MQWIDRIRSCFSSRNSDPGEDMDRYENELQFTQENDLNYDHDPFLHSLTVLQPEDIRLSKEPEKMTTRMKMQRLGQNIALVVCAAVFIGSCGMLIDNVLQKQKGAALYDEAANEFAAAGLDFGLQGQTASSALTGSIRPLTSGRTDRVMSSLSTRIQEQEQEDFSEIPSSSGYNEELEKLRALLRSYQERNEDVYGYLSIPSVGIEYVLVQGEDNDYYLTHNYKKEYLVIGSVFVDYRCNKTMMKNYNTILYGHNVYSENGSGSMLHNITEFLDETKFSEGLIYVYTMDGVFTYKPFSIYDTTADSGYIRTSFATRENFVEFAEQMQDRSQIASDYSFSINDRILTFSTCTNLTPNGRYAMHAVLIDAITG